jgi:hypothetical protein
MAMKGIFGRIGALGVLALACGVPACGSAPPASERTGTLDEAIEHGVGSNDERGVRIGVEGPHGLAGTHFAKGLCSGTLVAPGVVLTAGHCVYGFVGFSIALPKVPAITPIHTDRAAVYPGFTGDFGKQRDFGVVLFSPPQGSAFPPDTLDLKAAPTQGEAICEGRRTHDGDGAPDTYYESKPFAFTRLSSLPILESGTQDSELDPGDSGGGLFAYDSSSGRGALMGVNSASDAECDHGHAVSTGRSYWAGLDDAVITWVQGFVSMPKADSSKLPQAASVAERHYTIRDGCVYAYDDQMYSYGCEDGGTPSLAATDTCSGDAKLTVRSPAPSECGPGSAVCTGAAVDVEVDCADACKLEAPGRTLVAARCGQASHARCDDGTVPDVCKCAWRGGGLFGDVTREVDATIDASALAWRIQTVRH